MYKTYKSYQAFLNANSKSTTKKSPPITSAITTPTQDPPSIYSNTVGYSQLGTNTYNISNPWANYGTSTFLNATSGVVEEAVNNVPYIAPTDDQLGQGNALISVPIIQTNSQTLNQDRNLWISSFQTGSYTQFDNEQVHRGMVWFPIRRSEVFVQFTIAWPLMSTSNNDTTRGRNFQDMQNFQELIRVHQQQSVLTSNYPLPLSLTIYNNTGKNRSQTISDTNSSNLPLYGNNQLLIKQSNQLTNNNINLRDPSQVNSSTNTFLPNSTNPSNGQLQPLVYQGWIETISKQYTRYKSFYTMTYRMNVINPPSEASHLLVDNTGNSGNSLVPNVFDVQQLGQGWYGSALGINGGILNTAQIVG